VANCLHRYKISWLSSSSSSSRLRPFLTQKTQIEGLIRETEAALKELDKSSDDAVIYKSVGELLFKADKPKLTEELKERKDMMDLRLKTMAKQEERIQGRFNQLQEQLKQSLGQIPPKGG